MIRETSNYLFLPSFLSLAVVISTFAIINVYNAKIRPIPVHVQYHGYDAKMR